MEVRLDGGLEARRRSVERRRRSVASGQGKSERVRGKDQGEPPGSGARERKEQRALSWPGHGGGEVAAARSFWAAWRREGAPERGESGSRGQGVTSGAAAKLELASGWPRAAARGVAPSVGGGREQRSWRKGKRTQTKFPKTLGTNL